MNPSSLKAYSCDDKTSGAISFQLLDLTLEVGRQFSSYSALNNVLEQRKDSLGERWKKGRGNKNIKETNSKIKDTTKWYPEHLCYSILNYRCVHEGTFVTRSTETTPKRKRL